MILFRCWFCNKHYSVADERVGQRFVCTCERRVRVPRRCRGDSRDKTLGDWVIEFFVYGGGGAFLGAGLGLVIAGQVYSRFGNLGVRPGLFIAGLAAAGLLIGTLGGERGINWIGRRIRDK